MTGRGPECGSLRPALIFRGLPSEGCLTEVTEVLPSLHLGFRSGSQGRLPRGRQRAWEEEQNRTRCSWGRWNFRGVPGAPRLSGLVGPVWPLPPGAAAAAPGGRAQDRLEHQPEARSRTVGSALAPAAGRGCTCHRRWGCRRCAPGPGEPLHPRGRASPGSCQQVSADRGSYLRR